MADLNLVQLQQDIACRLLADAYFSDLTVVVLRNLIVANDVNAELVHLTVKDGKSGAGVIVGMPSVVVKSPNVDGPELYGKVAIRIREQPTINLGTGGTGKDGEAIALRVLALFHKFAIEGVGSFYAAEDALQPFLDDAEGVVGYMATLNWHAAQTPDPRLVTPTISEAALAVTLATTDAGATIYYTTDGTYPAAYTGSTATAYTVPFNVTSGTTVRFAAHQTGRLGSDAAQALIT